MKRKYIVISMALLSAVSTWAQEITGTVTDALGSPVAGAKDTSGQHSEHLCHHCTEWSICIEWRRR